MTEPEIDWPSAAAAGAERLATDGRVPADRTAAAVRCAFFVALFAINTTIAGTLLTAAFSGAVSLLVVGVVAPEFSLAPGLLASALIVFVMWRARSLQSWRVLWPGAAQLPSVLAEPFQRAETGFIHLPLDESPNQLLGLSAWLFAFSAVTQLASFAFFEPTIVSVIASCLSATGCILFAVDAAKLAKRRSVATHPTAYRSDLGILVTHLILYATLGQSIAILSVQFVRPFLSETLFPYVSLTDPRSVLSFGVEVGVTFAVLASSATKGRRAQTLVGMAVSAGSDRWLPVFAAPALSLVAVTLIAATQALTQQRRLMLRVALAQGWRFAFGAALGRVLGRIVGIFFFGPSGEHLGAVYGERVASVLLTTRPRAP